MIQLHCAWAINPLYKNPSLFRASQEKLMHFVGSEATCRPFHIHLGSTTELPTELSTIGEQRSDEQKCNANKRVGETHKEKNTQQKNSRGFSFFFFYTCVCARPQTHNRLPWSGLQAFAFVLLLSIVCLLLWTNYFFEWCCHLWINNRNEMGRMTVEIFKSLKKYHQ